MRADDMSVLLQGSAAGAERIKQSESAVARGIDKRRDMGIGIDDKRHAGLHQARQQPWRREQAPVLLPGFGIQFHSDTACYDTPT